MTRRRLASCSPPLRCSRCPPRAAAAPKQAKPEARTGAERDGEDRRRRPPRRQGDDLGHGPGHRHGLALRRPASRSKSSSTSTASRWSAARSRSSRGRTAPARFESSVILREDGKYAVSAKHAATPELGADETVRKSWKVELPGAEAGRVLQGRRGLQSRRWRRWATSPAAASASTAASAARSSPTAKSTTWTAAKRPARAWSRRSSAARAATTSSTRSAGEHVEVPLDKQVLALIKDGKPFAIYPVSTGKSSTPTITGHYEFYRQEPGYNSHGMYYSFYWHNGYAVHGYARSPGLRRQPRLRADLHRRPAPDLRTAPLRRVHLRLLRVCDAAHIGVLGRSCAEHASLPASLICLVTRPQDVRT